MKKLIAGILFVCMMFTFTGCMTEDTSVDTVQAKQQAQVLTEANNQVGMPNIKTFHEKKMLKEIYELRDDAKLITYTYTTALDGRKVFQFKSMGYGLPMSVQFSNPMKFQDGDYDLGEAWGGIILPQAEPNGLFMPDGLSATWVMRVNEDGSTEAVYMEEEITVSQTKLPRRLCAEWSLPSDY